MVLRLQLLYYLFNKLLFLHARWLMIFKYTSFIIIIGRLEIPQGLAAFNPN